MIICLIIRKIEKEEDEDVRGNIFHHLVSAELTRKCNKKTKTLSHVRNSNLSQYNSGFH